MSDDGEETDTLSSLPSGVERGPGVGETRPPSFHGGPSRLETADTADSIIREFDDTESSITSVSQIGRRQRHHGQGKTVIIIGRINRLIVDVLKEGECPCTGAEPSS